MNTELTHRLPSCMYVQQMIVLCTAMYGNVVCFALQKEEAQNALISNNMNFESALGEYWQTFYLSSPLCASGST